MFSPKVQEQQKAIPLYSTLYQIFLLIQQGNKKIKVYLQIRKEKLKMPFTADSMIKYIENPKKSEQRYWN